MNEHAKQDEGTGHQAVGKKPGHMSDSVAAGAHDPVGRSGRPVRDDRSWHG